MHKTDDLKILREQIHKLDDEILQMVAKRMDLCRRVGEYKKKNKLPIKDYTVEKKIIEKARKKALDYNIYSDMAESIIKTLIEYSVLEQDELIKPTPSSQGKNILIVGGLGLMGGWLAKFFESLGHNISLYDVKDPDHSTYFPFEKNLASGCEYADYIILATPLSETSKRLEELIEIKPKGIITEICSLKSPIINALEKGKKAGIKIASIHPMFGPDVEVLAGKNIILCETEEDSFTNEIEAILSKTSAQLIKIPLEQHDTLMSYILGSSHIINLIYGNLLKNSRIDLPTFQRVAGTTFKNQIEVTQVVIEENQDLYYEIQSYNDYTLKLINSISDVVNNYKKCITDKNRGEFKNLMEEARVYFNTFDKLK